MEKPLKFVMENLTPEMLEKARIELGETAECKEKALKELRALIEKEVNLEIPTTDEYLIQFLRCRKYDVKKTFKVLQNFWKIRRDYCHIYETIKLDRMKELLMLNIIGYLPYRDKEGCAIFIAKPQLWDPDQVPFEEVVQGISMLLNSAIKYPATQVCGVRLIADCRGLSWKQLKMATPSNVYFLLCSTQFSVALRIKAVHCITDNKWLDLFFKVCYPFMTLKLRQKVMNLGNDLEPLKQCIDSSVLPPELGGEGNPFNNNIWDQSFDKFGPEFIELCTHGYKN